MKVVANRRTRLIEVPSTDQSVRSMQSTYWTPEYARAFGKRMIEAADWIDADRNDSREWEVIVA